MIMFVTSTGRFSRYDESGFHRAVSVGRVDVIAASLAGLASLVHVCKVGSEWKAGC
jgi:hypothetical protein